MRYCHSIFSMFKGVNGQHVELGRVLAFVTTLSVIGLTVWKMIVHQEVTLTEYAMSLLQVLTGSMILIAGKDVARGKVLKAETEASTDA